MGVGRRREGFIVVRGGARGVGGRSSISTRSMGIAWSPRDGARMGVSGRSRESFRLNEVASGEGAEGVLGRSTRDRTGVRRCCLRLVVVGVGARGEDLEEEDSGCLLGGAVLVRGVIAGAGVVGNTGLTSTSPSAKSARAGEK